MASFSIQYIFRMVDQFTPGARKLAGAAKSMAGAVKSAGAAANAAVGSLARVGQAARAAGSGFQYYGNMALAAARKANQAAKTSVNAWLNGPRKGRQMNAGAALGALGIGFWGKGVIQTAKEASAAENRFLSLVDGATSNDMASMRSAFFKQMRITGEGYPDLLDAAGDAAQIVGDAGLARDITVAASGLAKIDTAGKSTKDFAENLAAIVGPDGTLEQVQKITDMLAKQQKLGAATAGGTIEAYKNVVGEKDLRKFDPIEMLTAIGMIKNKAPALQDSAIGNMAKYGLRTLSSPTSEFKKKLAAAGLSTTSFETDGAFDIAKTQQLFSEMVKTQQGLQKFKDLFSGKNVQAAQFWQFLAGMSPEEFEKYRKNLEDSAGTMFDALKKRTQGLEGALNSLQGSSRESALAFGEFLSPAVIEYAGYFEGLSTSLAKWVSMAKETYPTFTRFAGLALVAAGALSVLALPLAAITWGLSTLGVGTALRAIVGTIAGIAWGAAAAAASLGRILYLAGRFGGALGAAAMAARMLGRLLKFYLIFTGFMWFYENWDKIKALVKDPLQVNVLFPEVPPFFQWLMRGAAQAGKDFNAIGEGNYKMPEDPSQRSLPGIMYDWMKKLQNYYLGPGSTDAQPQSLGASQVPQALSVTTSIEPIQVQAGQLNVQYTGPIQGPSTVSVTGSAPRGQSTVEGGATAPAAR